MKVRVARFVTIIPGSRGSTVLTSSFHWIRFEERIEDLSVKENIYQHYTESLRHHYKYGERNLHFGACHKLAVGEMLSKGSTSAFVHWRSGKVLEDKGTLAKLGEIIRTNYNDRYDEIHHPKAGNVLSPNLVAHITKVETAKAKDLATKRSYVHAGKSWLEYETGPEIATKLGYKGSYANEITERAYGK
ncbi:60S Ribosomal Protein L7A [Manis pentadactyla]|nr:60S Ribosomal Protein L7A [Manis pentadactyla]